MTLEQIQYKLQEILNQYQENNRSHRSLNHSILDVLPSPDLKQQAIKDAQPPEGILTNIFSIIQSIEDEVGFQTNIVERTKELVFQPTDYPEDKAVSKY